jgi:hypothetical protein
MKTSIEKRGDRWVVLLNDQPHSNFATKIEALTLAGKLATKKPVGKMSWNDFKKAEGIEHIREEQETDDD